jgi:hypothetical protein
VFALSGFTDGQELTAANITTLKGKMATGFSGLVDLGNVAIKDLDTSKSIKLSALDDLKGFTTTALKSATIDGEGNAVTIDTNSATYGKFEKTDGLTVDGVKLTLTGSRYQGRQQRRNACGCDAYEQRCPRGYRSECGDR